MKDKEVEKIERLRECANVSFEEARDALKTCGGDLLEAMVYLERLGHAKKNASIPDPVKEEPKTYFPKADAVMPKQRKEGPTFFQKLGRLLGALVRKSMENYLVVSHDGTVKFRISLFAFAILFMFFSMGLVIVMGVSLFFGVKYSIAGKADMSRFNQVVGNAGDRAYQWWSNYRYSPEIDNLCRKYDNEDRNK